ncbi:unnamed protein product [Cyprideis torosa]|uniref:G-protein coupled receptors family 2 profile 2 domain-containing protein n=1 Tax=Cyprideis torosa TaxID=163714 RepID=A0A7R8WL24_9CRUS|nr:unnamed protein product [Cyprideis torosa]CAG0903871.1 unnamed protein product [Cyprideis torosa]
MRGDLLKGSSRSFSAPQCVEDKRYAPSSEKCMSDPSTCSGSGISFSVFFNREMEYDSRFYETIQRDLYEKEYLMSSGGSVDNKTPGVGLYIQGIWLVAEVVVSDGRAWVAETIIPFPLGAWSNIGLRWENPDKRTDPTVPYAGLQMYLNSDRRKAWAPIPTMTLTGMARGFDPPRFFLGCHADPVDNTLRHFGKGMFDEPAIWDSRINDTRLNWLSGGFVAEASRLEKTTDGQKVDNFLQTFELVTDPKNMPDKTTTELAAKDIMGMQAVLANFISANDKGWDELSKNANFKGGRLDMIMDTEDFVSRTLDNIEFTPDQKKLEILNEQKEFLSSTMKYRYEELVRQAEQPGEEFFRFPKTMKDVDAFGNPTVACDVPKKYCREDSKEPKFASIQMNYYRRAEDWIPTDKVDPLDNMAPYNRIDSKVVSIHLGGCEIDYTMLRQPGNQISCRFAHKIPEKAKTTREPLFHPEEEDFQIMIRRCARWNPDIDKFGSWDTSGCFIETTNPEETTLWDQFHPMMMQMAIACFIGNMFVVLTDIESVRDDRHTCTAFSVIIHYSYTAMGIWLALLCWAAFKAVTQGVIGGRLMAYSLLAWGLPLISVGVALMVNMQKYGTDPRCMIAFDNEIKWLFFGPLLIFATFGFLLACIVLCNLTTTQMRYEWIISDLNPVCFGLAFVCIYFGLTWSAGIPAYFVFSWTFDIPSFYPLFHSHPTAPRVPFPAMERSGVPKTDRGEEIARKTASRGATHRGETSRTRARTTRKKNLQRGFLTRRLKYFSGIHRVWIEKKLISDL